MQDVMDTTYFTMKLIGKLYMTISDPSSELSVIKMQNVELASACETPLISNTSGFGLNTTITNIAMNV